MFGRLRYLSLDRQNCCGPSCRRRAQGNLGERRKTFTSAPNPDRVDTRASRGRRGYYSLPPGCSAVLQGAPGLVGKNGRRAAKTSGREPVTLVAASSMDTSLVDDTTSATKFRVNRRTSGGAREDVGTGLAIKRCRKTGPDLVNFSS